MTHWTITMVFFLSVSLMVPSCNAQAPEANAPDAHSLPPQDFKASDLVGTWKSEWQEGPSSQILVFRSDGTFSQTYILKASGQEFDTQGTWFIVGAPEGCTYIHANGMRYYYGPESFVQSGNRNPDGTPALFWDACRKTVVEMPEFVLLGVGHDVGQSPQTFLYLMAVESDTAPPILWKENPAIP